MRRQWRRYCHKQKAALAIAPSSRAQMPSAKWQIDGPYAIFETSFINLNDGSMVASQGGEGIFEKQM